MILKFNIAQILSLREDKDMYDYIISDLDGTVYLDGKALPGAVEELNRMHEKGITLHFLTNNTSKTLMSYVEKLKKMGLPATSENVHNPTKVTAMFLKENFGDNPQGLVLGTTEFREDLSNFCNFTENLESPEFVLVSFDMELRYEKLRKACFFINKGVKYYQTHIDMYCPTLEGPIPDCGAMVEMIYHTTKKRPLMHFGKPGEKMKEYFSSVVDTKKRGLFFGDRLNTDIALGKAIGAKTVFVESGADRREDVESFEVKPDEIALSVGGYLKKV